MFKRIRYGLLPLLLAITVGCSSADVKNAVGSIVSDSSTSSEVVTTTVENESSSSYDFSSVPDYTGTSEDVVTINNNVPNFTDDEKNLTSSEIRLSELDQLGRCGQAFEVIGTDILPTETRKDIASIYPTGWHQAQYGSTYVYNRSHLLAFCLSGLNDEKRNLITGTEHMNQDVMADYEVNIRDYVRNSGNHVVYRVTPDFRDNELVARGVEIEAYSVEDSGQGICMNIYLYNTQPGVAIDYETGYTSSSDYVQDSTSTSSTYKVDTDEQMTFVVNSRNGKFHTSDCQNASKISSGNRQEMVSTVSQMIENGYDPAGCCIRN